MELPTDKVLVLAIDTSGVMRNAFIAEPLKGACLDLL